MKLSPGSQVGPIHLADGIRPFNFWTFMYASLICVGMMATMNFAQGYILTEHLGIPSNEQGALSGQLTVITEIINILLVGYAGILADRIGRRPVLVGGTVILGVGYALYPFASTPAELYAYRCVFGLGVSAVAATIATIQNDYPESRSRGKMLGVVAMFNALGIILIAFAAGRLPAVLRDGFGMDPVSAGRTAYLALASLCFISAAVFQLGLKPGTPASPEARPKKLELLRRGLQSARNPRILLSYLAAFTARGDIVVAGTFLSLWAIRYGTENGMEAADAFKAVTIPYAVLGMSGLLFAAFFGWLMDRINRMSALCLSLALASVGYCSMAVITSPIDLSMLPFFVVLGAGQSAAMMATFLVVGHEARHEERGAVTGVLSTFGALGILCCAWLGGILFDRIAPWAPFLFVGSLQALLLIGAVVVRVQSPGTIRPGTESAMMS